MESDYGNNNRERSSYRSREINMNETEKIKRVLAVIEPGAEEQPVLDRVAYLAKSLDFELKLVCSDYTQYLVEGYYFSEAELPKLRDEYLAERKELLEALAAPLRDGGLSVETEAIWSHPPFEGVVQLATQFGADLVIQHVSRHAALSRMLLSNDDWQTARHCPVPLMMVKDKPWKHDPVILAAVDPMHARAKPSGLDHKILSEGNYLAEKLGGTLYAAHAYGQFPLSGLYPADAEKRHREALDDLAAEFELPETRRLMLDEAPEYALKKLEGELQTDLVMVGAVSRSLIKDMLIGSTTEKVLDSLDCDVLLLRPE